MKTLNKLLIVLILSSGAAYADEWEPMEGAVYAATVADYLQTRQIRKRDDLEERGFVVRGLCGANPSELCALAWAGFKLYHMNYVNNRHMLRNAGMWNGKIKWKNFVNALYLTVHMPVIHSNNKNGLKINDVGKVLIIGVSWSW